MATVIDVADRAALEAVVRSHLREANELGWDLGEMRVEPRGYDSRIGWDTHIVTVDGWGVVGMTDGPADT